MRGIPASVKENAQTGTLAREKTKTGSLRDELGFANRQGREPHTSCDALDRIVSYPLHHPRPHPVPQ
jgi:hypothetical protein